MPNWVTNNITMKVINKDLVSHNLIDKIKEEVKSDDSEFDFIKIAPLPKELENTRCPMKVISQAEYDEQERKIANDEYDKDFGISRCLTQELIDEYKQKFGACEWYEWQIANWGTKWNACDVYVNDDFISFNTAWSTPHELMVHLSKKYPDVEFSVEYADEDFGHNVGRYVLINGVDIKIEIPKGGSREAIELAIEIQGGEDYYLFEYFTQVNGGVRLSKHTKILIDIAYSNDCLPSEDCGYPKNVLNRFKELALADENYELIVIIENELKK